MKPIPIYNIDSLQYLKQIKEVNRKQINAEVLIVGILLFSLSSLLIIKKRIEINKTNDDER